MKCESHNHCLFKKISLSTVSVCMKIPMEIRRRRIKRFFRSSFDNQRKCFFCLQGQHPNIVTVREIVVGSNMDKIFIVMDYVEHDLKGLMETMRERKQVFIPGLYNVYEICGCYDLSCSS